MKLLLFDMGTTTFGVDIQDVREIISYMSPDQDGDINLRGQVIPIVDLAKPLGVELNDISETTCIVIAKPNDKFQGFIVDRVLEVLDSDVNDETGQAKKIDLSELIN